MGGKPRGRIGFCGMQVHSFLNLAVKGNGTLLCNSRFVWFVDSEANSLISSLTHSTTIYWLPTRCWDWTRHVDTVMTNRVIF